MAFSPVKYNLIDLYEEIYLQKIMIIALLVQLRAVAILHEAITVIENQQQNIEFFYYKYHIIFFTPKFY